MMYCIYCGKKIEGGTFCPYCGKKVVPVTNAQPPNSNETKSNNTVTAVHNTSNKRVFVIIGAAVLALVVVFVITHGRSRNQFSNPYNINPYSNSQNLIQPPANFSYDFSDDSYDNSDDTYSYGSSTQTCISCHGSGSCDICNGTGQYSMYGNDLSECTACYGTGDCSICGGDGVY